MDYKKLLLAYMKAWGEYEGMYLLKDGQKPLEGLTEEEMKELIKLENEA